MKILVYTLLLLLGVSRAHAQENRGNLLAAKVIQRSIMVGGGINGAYRSIENHTSSNSTQSGSKKQIDVQGRFGYFVINDLAVGVLGTVSHTSVKMDGADNDPSTHILAGPFARYFLNNGIFGEASYGFGIYNLSNSLKRDISEIRGGVGYSLFINPKIAVEPAIMFTYYKEKNPANQDNYYTEVGPSINVGLQVYLFRERSMKR
ncbi:hypothetical protein [Rufibacter sp. DG15C]|uniref:hypothetical protein n=1 Tax=Rufibacter sp. DG15C TaxID=1379909 RepID=UPI000AE88A8F|nr:hypothetical protein [Rufibacter sp. DG15C]